MISYGKIFPISTERDEASPIAILPHPEVIPDPYASRGGSRRHELWRALRDLNPGPLAADPVSIFYLGLSQPFSRGHQRLTFWQ